MASAMTQHQYGGQLDAPAPADQQAADRHQPHLLAGPYQAQAQVQPHQPHHHHHQHHHQNQYASAGYQEQQPAAMDEQRQHHQQAFQQHPFGPQQHSQLANSDAHFYYAHPAGHYHHQYHQLDTSHYYQQHQHQQQQQQHYSAELANGHSQPTIEHYASQRYAPLIQSFNQSLNDVHQTYNLAAAAAYASEQFAGDTCATRTNVMAPGHHHQQQQQACNNNRHLFAHPPSATGFAIDDAPPDQGRRSAASSTDRIAERKKSNNSATNRNRPDDPSIDENQLFTELKILQPKDSYPTSLKKSPPSEQQANITEAASLKKRKRLVNNNTKKAPNLVVKDENCATQLEHDHHQHQTPTTLYDDNPDEHNHHPSSQAYLGSQRPLAQQNNDIDQLAAGYSSHQQQHRNWIALTSDTDKQHNIGASYSLSSPRAEFVGTNVGRSNALASINEADQLTTTNHQRQTADYPLPANTRTIDDCHFAPINSSYTDDTDELANTSDRHQQEGSNISSNEYNQLRILEMRKEKSRDAARSRRSKENHEFYELAKLLPLPAAITSQLDFLDKASIIRLTISFLKLRQFSVNGHPPWAPDFTTLGSINPYSSQPLSNYHDQSVSSNQPAEDHHQSRPTSVNSGNNNHGKLPTTSSGYNNQTHADLSNDNRFNLSAASLLTPSSVAFPLPGPYNQSAACHPDGIPLMIEKGTPKNASLFDVHQGTHILQSLDGFAFAIGRDGRFLYISETVSMYLGLSQVEMTGSSVFDYTHQQDHEELARQLGIAFTKNEFNLDQSNNNNCESPPPTSVQSQYSAASSETLIEDYVNSSNNCSRKRLKVAPPSASSRGAYARANSNSHRTSLAPIKSESLTTINNVMISKTNEHLTTTNQDRCALQLEHQTGTESDPLVRQFCIRMKSTLTKRGCQHFKSSGYRVVHVVAHLRSYQSNDHGHLMDPLDEASNLSNSSAIKQPKRRGPKSQGSKETTKTNNSKESSKGSNESDTTATKSVEQNNAKPKIIGMVAVAIALPPPSINELRLESDTFVLRLGLDLRITHVEPKITELLHYPVELIAGRSLYSLIHPADVNQVRRCHKDLLKKGQMMSGYYRLLSRTGGYIWIQTCATLICNNNALAGQISAPGAPLANSPRPPTPNINSSSSSLSTPTTTHLASHQQHPITPSTTTTTNDNNLSKVSNFFSPRQQQVEPNQPATSFNLAPASSATSHPKLMSPSLSSSHLGSAYENLDQDQCVIFVNYMITNVIEKEEILDICQSKDFVPIGSFSGNTTNNNSNNYNSPSSSCSSPCLASLKASNTSCSGSYASPSTPISNNSVNLTPPSSRHRHNQQHNNDNYNKPVRETKSAHLKRISAKATRHQQQTYLSGNENDNHAIDNSTSNNNNSFSSSGSQTDPTKFHENIDYDSSIASTEASIYSNYPAAHGSVNLALTNKVHHQTAEASGWPGHHHHHHQPATGSRSGLGEAAAAVAVYGAAVQSTTDYSATMNRSIYKAAFAAGLTDATQYNTSSVYPGAAANPSSYQSQTAATWDTATAAAAVAVAASSNLSGHHHSAAAAAANPYAHHLDSHHHHHHPHHHQAHSSSSTATATASNNHHHASPTAGPYYNYYGYYGNKFI